MSQLDQVISFQFTGRFAMHLGVGITLLIFASFFRTQGLINMSTWQSIRRPVMPSLQASPSPADRVTSGIEGCLFAWVYGFLYWLLLFLGLDQIFLQGATLNQIYLFLTVDVMNL